LAHQKRPLIAGGPDTFEYPVIEPQNCDRELESIMLLSILSDDYTCKITRVEPANVKDDSKDLEQLNGSGMQKNMIKRLKKYGL